jgi:histone deacetylase 4/5
MTQLNNDGRVSVDTVTNIEDVKQKNVFVWYTCYGSSLCKERFNCYLRDGSVDGMSHPCVGARDPTPAQKSLVLQMPYRVFFAYAKRSAWGYGGSAMLDVKPNQKNKSFMRLYKVTLQQFNDIVS